MSPSVTTASSSGLFQSAAGSLLQNQGYLKTGGIAPYICDRESNRERDGDNRTSRIQEDIQIAEEETRFRPLLSRAGLGDIIFNFIGFS